VVLTASANKTRLHTSLSQRGASGQPPKSRAVIPARSVDPSTGRSTIRQVQHLPKGLPQSRSKVLGSPPRSRMASSAGVSFSRMQRTRMSLVERTYETPSHLVGPCCLSRIHWMPSLASAQRPEMRNSLSLRASALFARACTHKSAMSALPPKADIAG
jgi:hypothetical protein